MKKTDREHQRRERRETNEANRARNRAVGVMRVATVETLPALREPEIIDARPVRREESIAAKILRSLRAWHWTWKQ